MAEIDRIETGASIQRLTRLYQPVFRQSNRNTVKLDTNESASVLLARTEYQAQLPDEFQLHVLEAVTQGGPSGNIITFRCSRSQPGPTLALSITIGVSGKAWQWLPTMRPVRRRFKIVSRLWGSAWVENDEIALSASPKGYLDHLVESDKAHKEFLKLLAVLTEITNENTKRTIASTERIKKINQLPYIQQGRAKLAESRRSARSYDKTTKRMNAQIPLIEKAVNALAPSNLAFWRWYTANHVMTAAEAQGLIQNTKTRLSTAEAGLHSMENRRISIEALRGTSRVFDEAIDRHLIVQGRLRKIMASELEPLRETISLLEQHAKEPPVNVSAPSPSSPT
jgi:hypothetical protein